MGPAALGGALAAVVLAGAATGVALERSDTVDLVAEPEVQATLDAVPYAVCPGEDHVGEVHRGDRVFLTGTNAEGTWVELRAPYDVTRRVWVETEWVVPDESVAGLPVVACAEALIDVATPNPTASTTVPTTSAPPASSTTTSTSSTTSTTPTTTEPVPDAPTSTATPTTPPPAAPPATTTTPAPPPSAPTTVATSTTTTTTTVPADVTGPTIGRPAADPSEIWEDAAFGGCPTQPHVTTISVSVSDLAGVAAVDLRYDTGTGPVTATMVPTGDDRYETVLGPFAENEVAADTPITLTVVAVDAAGNTSTTTEAGALVLNHCSIG